MIGECFLCHQVGVLEKHHIFGGSKAESGATALTAPAEEPLATGTDFIPIDINDDLPF